MRPELVCVVTAVLALQIIGASTLMCPNDPNCVCGGTLAVELNCNIDGRIVKINLLPNTYLNIKCENSTSLDYNKLPKCANNLNSFKSVSFKDCPLPSTSFKDVLTNLGVSKTMALIFQNAKNLSGYFDRKHFAGLQDLTKLLLSINGITRLPDNLFMDINRLTWLNIRSNSINLSEELFKPLERLETLEISHNHMTNISSNLFSHLTLLRKLSLWQSNVTWFSEDFFSGVDVLEELDLSSNGLNELPWSIFKPLKKLKKLTLLSNKFSALPQNLFQYNHELETVVILNNDVKLIELPRLLFGNLWNLKQIYIQRCGLENIPYNVFANSPHITNISLAYNNISALPESIFNDQIKLLELDLSHNNLKNLEPKIFSSLVRLRRLDLHHNSLVEVSRTTFSSLLSLIYVNIENNKLETVEEDIFRNNRQKLSITLAYNRLSFAYGKRNYTKWGLKSHNYSPFCNTYNFRLLNLSHNEIELFFGDLWANSHDILDLSHNRIKILWDDEESPSSKIPKYRTTYHKYEKNPLREVWIGHNPLSYECKNFHFIDFIQEQSKTKIPDLSSFKYPLWSRESCYMRNIIFISLIVILVPLYIVMIILFIFYRKQVNSFIKRKLCERRNKQCDPQLKLRKRDKNRDLLVLRYCVDDEEFMMKEVIPAMKSHNMIMEPVRNDEDSFVRSLFCCVKDTHNDTNIVLFSPNYLTKKYSHVNIKKIHGEMSKAENTVYMYADIGPENSIYAFLKEQRDEGTSIMWSEVGFWNKIQTMLSVDHKKRVGAVSKKDDTKRPRKLKMPKAKLPGNISFSKLPDCTM